MSDTARSLPPSVSEDVAEQAGAKPRRITFQDMWTAAFRAKEQIDRNLDYLKSRNVVPCEWQVRDQVALDAVLRLIGYAEDDQEFIVRMSERARIARLAKAAETAAAAARGGGGNANSD